MGISDKAAPGPPLTPQDALVRVVFQLPFSTEIAFDPSFLNSAAQEAHRLLIAPSHAGKSSAWRVPTPWNFDGVAAAATDLELQFYGEPLLAHLGRSLPHRVVERSVADHRTAPLQADRNVRWERRSVVTDLWSIGIGLLTATYRLTPSSGVTWPELAHSVDTIRADGDEFASLTDLMRTAVSELEAHAPGEQLSLPSIADPLSRVAPLWNHVVFLVELPHGTVSEQRWAITQELLPDGTNYPQLSPSGNAAIRLGLSATAAYLSGHDAEATAVARLTGVHTAIWGSASDLDRQLFRHLERSGASLGGRLHELERHSDALLIVYQRVRTFRTAIEVVPLHLTRHDTALWRTLADQWGLSGQLQAVDDKLQALNHVYGQIATSLTDRRARRLGDFVFVFTAAGVISVGLQAADFTGAKGPALLNVAFLVVLILATAAVWTYVRRAVDDPAGHRWPVNALRARLATWPLSPGRKTEAGS